MYAAVFSPDGTRALTGSAGGTARIWDTTTGRELPIPTGHTDVVLAVAFSPDGTRALTSSADDTARIWDTATGREVARWRSDRPVWWCRFGTEHDEILIVDDAGLHRLRLVDA